MFCYVILCMLCSYACSVCDVHARLMLGLCWGLCCAMQEAMLGSSEVAPNGRFHSWNTASATGSSALAGQGPKVEQLTRSGRLLYSFEVHKQHVFFQRLWWFSSGCCGSSFFRQQHRHAETVTTKL